MQRLIAVAAAILLASLMSWAKSGASLYKSKCAACHGPQGQGKSAPKIAGTGEAKVVDVLTNGGKSKGPHTKPMPGLSPDQAKHIGAYVQSLK